MKLDAPHQRQIPGLRRLWKLAFEDTDAFLDTFFSTAFAPDRCRCVTLHDQVVAALYWFRCELEGQKLAYLYAVATHPEHRKKGICRALLEDTHAHLASLGYDGVILVPQEEPLRKMYEKSGYRSFGTLAQFSCTAASHPASIRAIDPEEYARLRRQYLPAGGVVQEEENLALLRSYARFYAGPDYLLAACADAEQLRGIELLGNASAAPEILRSLGFGQGTFRTPGGTGPFAMFHPLTDGATVPSYFALALD